MHILLTIWFAVGGVDGVRAGLNRTYGIRETRSIIALYAVQVAMVILASLALVMVRYWRPDLDHYPARVAGLIDN